MWPSGGTKEEARLTVWLDPVTPGLLAPGCLFLPACLFCCFSSGLHLTCLDRGSCFPSRVPPPLKPRPLFPESETMHYTEQQPTWLCSSRLPGTLVLVTDTIQTRNQMYLDLQLLEFWSSLHPTLLPSPGMPGYHIENLRWKTTQVVSAPPSLLSSRGPTTSSLPHAELG